MVVNSFACRARNYLGRHPSPPTARISIFEIFNQMMRKTILHGTRHVVTTLLLAAAFLSLAQPSDAAPITRKQAEQRAAKFFHKRMARRAAPVSADDTQAPIIGFSDSGHLDYFNDTVIVYRSPDYLVAPFVVVQTYQDNVISEQKQRVVDNWTIPDKRSLFLSRMQFRRVG